jgi:hypothetical protein
MALQFYIDDSGSEPNSSIFVLAGFMSSDDMWMEFSKTWQSTLSNWDIDNFKTRDAMNFGGIFSRKNGWHEEKRNILISSLMNLIETYAFSFAYASISWDNFLNLTADIRAPVRFLAMDSPYVALMNEIFINGASHVQEIAIANNTLAEPVEFIFDRQVGFDLDASNWIPNLTTIVNENRNSSLSALIPSRPKYASDDSNPALQAADLCAWHIHHVLSRPTSLWTPSKAIYQRIMTMPGFGREIPPEELHLAKSRILKIVEEWVARNPLSQAYSYLEWRELPRSHRRNAIQRARALERGDGRID